MGQPTTASDSAPAPVSQRRIHLPGKQEGADVYHRAANRARWTAWRALRHRAFACYFAGSLINSLGSWLQNTAQVLLTYQLTRSVLAVGLITGAQFSTSLALGPWAAVVASRLGGRRMLIAVQLCAAALAAALAILQMTGRLSEGLLISGALGLGLAFTFALPVQTALVARLVPEADTEAALAMNSVSYNAGRALGPALCVLLISTSGFGWAFGLNALSYLVFALALRLTRPTGEGTVNQPAKARDGLTVALQQPRILLLLAMVAAVTLADDPVLILGPALATRMGVSSDWAGYFLSALGCGTILGSLRPARDPTGEKPSPTSHRAAKSLLVLVAAMVLFAGGVHPLVSLGAAFLAGAAALRTGAVTQTQLVRQRPDRSEPVMALWAMAWAGSKPVASLFDGWWASGHGLWMTAALLGAPASVIGLLEISLGKGAREAIKRRGRMLAARLDRQLHETG